MAGFHFPQHEMNNPLFNWRHRINWIRKSGTVFEFSPKPSPTYNATTASVSDFSDTKPSTATPTYLHIRDKVASPSWLLRWSVCVPRQKAMSGHPRDVWRERRPVRGRGAKLADCRTTTRRNIWFCCVVSTKGNIAVPERNEAESDETKLAMCELGAADYSCYIFRGVGVDM